MRRILVSGASGIVGYGILRSLRQSGKALQLVGTSIHGDSVAPAFCDVFELAPATDDASYLPWLLSLVRRHRIDMAIPGIEIDMYTWADHVAEIAAAGAVPLLNTPALIGLCKDKWAFHERLAEAGLGCVIASSLEADFEALSARFGLPFLLKPRRGFGSKGIVRVDGPETFARYREALGPRLMAQPIVGSDEAEYTISAFGDGDGGYVASMTLRRKLSPEGFTDRAEVVDGGAFDGTLAALCRWCRPVGPTNFQFRTCSDGPKLLEINPRISSATSIRTAFGYNESAMAVDYFLEHRVPPPPVIRRGRAVRYTDERIFYEDGLHL
jgi:carbamoyl-phosphate synthase large subunit